MVVSGEATMAKGCVNLDKRQEGGKEGARSSPAKDEESAMGTNMGPGCTRPMAFGNNAYCVPK